MTQRYPLHWPEGWPRARDRRAAQFGTTARSSVKQKLTVAEAIERLQSEFDALGALSLVLSTNLEVRLNGSLRLDQRAPADPGAAVYFTLGGKATALACDRWDRVADNIAAIAKHIEALRGIDRWGVGTAARTFAGYQALPAPEQWWQVLGVGSQATAAEIGFAYRAKAKAAHETGQGEAALARLNIARDEAMKNPTARGTS